MPGLLALAAERGVRAHVLWLGDFVHEAELGAMLTQASVFVTPFDESTPTSVRAGSCSPAPSPDRCPHACMQSHLCPPVPRNEPACIACFARAARHMAQADAGPAAPLQGTLLMAMAHGLAVVSTPYHFALEVLHSGRGLLVPFADKGHRLAKAICRLLDDSELRSAMVSTTM